MADAMKIMRDALREIQDITSRASLPITAQINEIATDAMLAADGRSCACLSELADDAYEPGGPMSGKTKPVCPIHSTGETRDARHG